MPIISVDATYIRYIGSAWSSYQRVTIELRDLIQYRILGVAEFQPMLGPLIYELQMVLRQLNEEELSLGAQIRELYGWADQVDSAMGGGYGAPGSFLQPTATFTNFYPAVTTSYVSRFPSWYNDPVSLRWLGGAISFGRRGSFPEPFDWNFGSRRWGGGGFA